MFDQAARLEPKKRDIVGDVEPRTLMRALDKKVWWAVDLSKRGEVVR